MMNMCDDGQAKQLKKTDNMLSISFIILCKIMFLQMSIW